MPMSQPAQSSFIDLSGLAARVLETLTGLAAVCCAPLASEPCPAAFEEVERRVRESVNVLGCAVLGSWIERLDDGAGRAGRAATVPCGGDAEDDHERARPGDLRARYRHGVGGLSFVPVDESLGLVNDWLTRPAARLGLMMMGHGTAREAEEFFSEMGAMTPSAPSSSPDASTAHGQPSWPMPIPRPTTTTALATPPDAPHEPHQPTDPGIAMSNSRPPIIISLPELPSSVSFSESP